MGTITLIGKARLVQVGICRVAAYLNKRMMRTSLTSAAIFSFAFLRPAFIFLTRLAAYPKTLCLLINAELMKLQLLA